MAFIEAGLADAAVVRDQVPGPYCRNIDAVPEPPVDTKGAPKGAPPSAHAPKGEGGQKGAAKG